MLTRIEISGFKTFSDFALDVPPFLVVAGTNASGKSNFFDAIRFLSTVAEHDLGTTVKAMRGEFDELFRRTGERHATTLRFAAEVLLEPRVRDPWGEISRLSQHRLRYELDIERRKGDSSSGERLFVARESVTPIRASGDRIRRALGSDFRQHLSYRRREPLLSTTSGARPEFKLHQDGKAGRERPAVSAEATVLSSISTADTFPHLFALREEFRKWRFLQLDPGSLRRSTPYQAQDMLDDRGENLGGVLARLKLAGDEFRQVVSDLASLIPGLVDVDVIEDDAEKRWEIQIRFVDQPPLSARVASDGTLRLLGLVTALNDPSFGGVICLEEPENGVHPARVRPLVELMRNAATDFREHEARPYVQVLANTHSPAVVATTDDIECVFFDTVTELDAGPTRATKTRSRRVVWGDLLSQEDAGVVTRLEVDDYLQSAARTT